MSAIAGILGIHSQAETVQKMLSTMTRRGPGGSGVYRSGDTWILHGSAGTEMLQPISLEWADETYRITCDGELYNSEELREELTTLGHDFKGDSCAEVLLRAYIQWKEEALHKLNGVFALVIWEEKAGRLFLARDRIGVKPLFFTQCAVGLLFASEIKTLLAHPSVPAELDAVGAGELLLLGPGRTPGSGVFRSIRELEPGCCAVFEKGKLIITRYWKLMDREHTEGFEATSEKVRHLILDAIRRQTAGEASLGSFLSGGLDSSLIASVVSRDREVDTFSVDYLDNDKYFTAGMFQPNSDPEYIRTMQDYLGSRHHWTVLSPEELISGIEEAAMARDLPGMADVDVSLKLFCQQVKPHVDTVLSGECADEIFGGYPWYRDPSIRNFDGFPWARTTQERTRFLAPWLREQMDPAFFVYDRYRQTLKESEILPGTDPVNTRIKQLVNLNFRWFMQTLLDRGDRMGGWSGLNIRMPLCDYRIAEYLYNVPWEMKNHQGREKGLLRHAMREYLPEKVLTRKKSPYPKTHHPRFLALAEEKLRLLLQEKDAPIFQLVPRNALEDLLHQDFPWPWYGQLMRRPQTIVYMLQINFWLKHYSVRIV